MLAEIFIEALLLDEEAADQVWEAWDSGEVDDQLAWLLLVNQSLPQCVFQVP